MSRNKRGGVKPDMNVTPLVDVVLVLLIIFMVVTPQMDQAKSVEVPEARQVDAKNDVSSDPLKISVTHEGEIWIEKEQVEEATLRDKLATLMVQGAKRRVVIKGDRGARYGAIDRVFVACQQAGFIGVALEVKQRKA